MVSDGQMSRMDKGLGRTFLVIQFIPKFSKLIQITTLIALLPLPPDKESVGTLGVHVGSKLREQIGFARAKSVTDIQTPIFII